MPLARPPDPSLAGYWPSLWPAEDGGPRRTQSPATEVDATGFGLGPGDTLTSTNRTVFAGCMVVVREQGEVFLQGNTIGAADTTSWVERIDPHTLETVVRSPDLAGGPFWPGGIAAHADGSLYVTYGRWCHRLDAHTLEVVTSRELPRDAAYNSLVVLASGHLVMKDFAGGQGAQALPTGRQGSELVVLTPGDLEIVARHELGEGSIARLSATAPDLVVVVGDTNLITVRFDADSRTLHETQSTQYRNRPGQGFGWDIVLEGDSGWFLDDGEGTEAFGPSFAGKGIAAAPLQLIRVGLGAEAAGRIEATEICGAEGGIVANPPCVDPQRRVAVGFDSGNGVLGAWRFGEWGDPWEPLWRRDQHHGAHMIRFPGSGELLTHDFDHERGMDQAVVLDIESGTELGRVDTGSPLQSVVFQAAGFERDAYVVSFANIARLSVS